MHRQLLAGDWSRITCNGILLVAFALTLVGLTSESLWGDEVWSLWAVRDGWMELGRRVAGDVHPPLYFLLLRGWTIVAGESSYAVRFLSACIGLVGLAITYTVGKRLFDHWTSLIAMLWLGSNGLWLYYGREVRMYSLLLCLAALSLWWYWRWLQQPHRLGNLLGLAISNAALLYTHYAGGFLLVSQLVHCAFTHPRQWRRAIFVGTLTILLYLPWLPFFLQQIVARPGGLANQPTAPTNWATTVWLLQALTGGVGLLLLVPYIIGKGWHLIYHRKSTTLLLGLWVLLSPLLMLGLNAWGVAFYEVRYIIGVLPALALLVGYGIRNVRWRWLAAILLLFFIGTNLSSLQWLRPPKAPWEATIQAALTAREPQEPTLVALIEPLSLEVHYDRVLGIRSAATVDLATLRHQPRAIRQTLDQFATAPIVWVMMPSNIGATWLTAGVLDATHGIGYRDAVDYMLFYRFDHARKNDLDFRFGSSVRYRDALFAEDLVYAPGDQYCRQLTLEVLSDEPPHYAMGMHLIDGANHLVAQHDQELGLLQATTELQPTFCIHIPQDASPGIHYLHLVLYRQRDGIRLPVYEQNVPWGNALIFTEMEIQLDDQRPNQSSSPESP